MMMMMLLFLTMSLHVDDSARAQPRDTPAGNLHSNSDTSLRSHRQPRRFWSLRDSGLRVETITLIRFDTLLRALCAPISLPPLRASFYERRAYR